jgi:hypothetical protein
MHACNCNAAAQRCDDGSSLWDQFMDPTVASAQELLNKYDALGIAPAASSIGSLALASILRAAAKSTYAASSEVRHLFILGWTTQQHDPSMQQQQVNEEEEPSCIHCYPFIYFN